jgi:hypothetical protein
MKDTKRYLLFVGMNYYPSGGWEDYKSSHETAEEAETEGKRLLKEDKMWSDWYHVVDLETGRMVS